MTYPSPQQWPSADDPADPGVQDDAGTLWPFESVVRPCEARPNIRRAEIDAEEHAEAYRKRKATASRQAAETRDRARRGVVLPQRRGTGIHNAKLTDDIVRGARLRFDSGVSCVDLAKHHRVGVHTMWCALTRRTWRHVR